MLNNQAIPVSTSDSKLVIQQQPFVGLLPQQQAQQSYQNLADVKQEPEISHQVSSPSGPTEGMFIQNLNASYTKEQ